MIISFRPQKASVLIWVVIFTTLMMMGYFYFSLTLNAALLRQNNLVIKKEGEIILEGKLEEYINPIPTGRTKINQPSFYLNITKFKDQITGFLDPGYAKEYHFMKNLDEADEAGRSKMEKINKVYVCWGELKTIPTARLLSWSAGNTGLSFANTNLVLSDVPAGPGHVCEGYRSVAVADIVIQASGPHDYLLYLATPSGSSYKLIALDSTGKQTDIPDAFYFIYARWRGKNNVTVEKFINDRQAYTDGSISNLPYNLYHLFCNEKSHTGYSSC